MYIEGYRLLGDTYNVNVPWEINTAAYFLITATRKHVDRNNICYYLLKFDKSFVCVHMCMCVY